MIGYYLQCYGPDEDWEIFNQNNNHYNTFQKEKIARSLYWEDILLLLIQYHLSTKNNVVDFDGAMKIRKKISNYSSKEKSISVIFPVILEDFLKLSLQEKKQKFADDAVYAVKLVQERLEKKKLDIDFNKLILDLEKCNKEYLTN